jgi:hypothetical protein
MEIQKILADAHQPLTMPQVMPLMKVLMEGVQRERLKSGRRAAGKLLQKQESHLAEVC